jgi:rod shape-determining protein MreD
MNNPIGQTVLFFVYLLVQVFFIKDLDMFGVAFCFVYINYILTLPLHFNKSLLLLVSFFLGLGVDAFYDSLGMHAFACVMIAFLRDNLIQFISSKNEIYELSIKASGFSWFFAYTLALVFVHHFFLFYIQKFNFQMFFDTFFRVLMSTLYTTFLIIIIQYLFYTPSRQD